MFKRILIATACVAGLTVASWSFGSSQEKGQSCACCEVCVCADCACDELDCACGEGGDCACSAGCGTTCCSKS